MASHNNSEMGPVHVGKDAQFSASANTFDDESNEDYHDSLRGYTRQDRADMTRMGKTQELKRNYRPLSALAFTVILQGTWEVLMT